MNTSAMLVTPTTFLSRIILLLLCMLFPAHHAHAQLVTWDLTGNNSAATNPLPATTLGANIASASMTLGSGITTSMAKDTFGGQDFDTTSLANAISNGDYLSFTVTPASGFSFNASSLTLTFGVATAVTNFNVALLTSATGFASGDSIWTFSFSTASPAAQSITLSGFSNLQGLSSATEFRLYGFRDIAGTTTFRFRDLTGNDVSLAGSTSAIPEPSTYAAIFGGLALAGAVWHRQRQRKVG